MSDLSLEDQNFDSRQTELIGQINNGNDYVGSFILQVRPAMVRDAGNGHFPPFHAMTAIQATGNATNGTGVGVEGIGGESGTNGPGIGLRGIGVNGGAGVVGLGNQNAGVVGGGFVGALGVGSNSGALSASLPPTFTNAGVLGACFDQKQAAGIIGESDVGYGVYGVSTSGIGVRGDADAKPGVFGESVSKEGVFGYGDTGVRGEGNSIGVQAISATEIGLYAQSGPFLGQKGPPGVAAGIFVGPVMVAGPFTVFSSAKSVAVKDSRGEFRQLFCMESPESWFEDFGEAALIKGKAQVKLDPLFASLVKTKGYHVFLSPYGDCNGLYVSARSASGFSVHERQRGGSNIDFSYRIVARRKDVAAERLPKIDAPRSPVLEAIRPEPRSRRPARSSQGLRVGLIERDDQVSARPGRRPRP